MEDPPNASPKRPAEPVDATPAAEPLFPVAPSLSDPAPRTMQKLGAALSTVSAALKALGVLLLGLGFGMALDRALLQVGLPNLLGRTISWLAGLSVVLVLLLVAMFGLKRALERKLQPQAKKVVEGIAKEEFEQKLSYFLYGKPIRDEQLTTEERRHRIQQLRELVSGVVQVVLAGYGMRQGIILLGMLLGGTVAFATLLTAYLQVDRLDAQNALILVQTRLTVSEQDFQADSARAEASYRQIADILLSPDSTEQSQILALNLLPEAMRMPVTRATISLDGGVSLATTHDYPNAFRLQRVLMAFMRHDRIGRQLDKSGLVGQGRTERGVSWQEFERVVASQAAVSDAIIAVLHRLGPSDGQSSSESLWLSAEKSSFITLPEPRPLPKVQRPGSEDGDDSGLLIYDLSYLGDEDLRGVQLPFVMTGNRRQNERGWVKLRPGMLMDGARLDGARLDGMDLRGISFVGSSFRGSSLERADLSRTVLSKADLRGANLRFAVLDGATAREALMQGADFWMARLWAAELDHSQLQGTVLLGAELNGASLRFARLNGASMQGVHLIGSSLKGAKFHGADLSGAMLAGAGLCADFRGAQLTKAKLYGARLAMANLEGADMTNAQLQPASVPLVTNRVKTSSGTEVVVYSHPSEGGVPVQFPAAIFLVNFLGETQFLQIPSPAEDESRWLQQVWHIDERELRDLLWHPETLEETLTLEELTHLKKVLRPSPSRRTVWKGADFTKVWIGSSWIPRLGGAKGLDAVRPLQGPEEYWAAYPLPYSKADEDKLCW